LSRFSVIDEILPISGTLATGRGNLSSARLEEHLRATAKGLRKLGVRPGDCVASALHLGPDATTAAMAARLAGAKFTSLPLAPRERYQSLLLEIDAKLLLTNSIPHSARDAAYALGIPVANVLRHFEAGLFTLESALAPTQPAERPLPHWKNRNPGVSLVLIASAPTYRPLANRLDACNPVIGITPPSLEQLSRPHTIEHLAVECVRILRRCRPQGPYALAGWRAEGLVALETARLLEESGEKVAFVAMLDAAELFFPPMNPVRRILSSVSTFFRNKYSPSCQFMAEALRQYLPRPWYGKILHIGESNTSHGSPWFHWNSIAPHGIFSYKSIGEMLAEPSVQKVATILAAELEQARP
jgi:thioesterase domain-containing protein